MFFKNVTMLFVVCASLLAVSVWPQQANANTVCVGPTGATCAGCETPSVDSTQRTNVENSARAFFDTAYKQIIGALNNMQSAVQTALQAKGITYTQITMDKMRQDLDNATHINQNRVNVEVNKNTLAFEKTITPTVNDCVQQTAADQLTMGSILQDQVVVQGMVETRATANPLANVQAAKGASYEMAKKMLANDWLSLGIPEDAEKLKELAASIDPDYLFQTQMATGVNGQCLTSNAVFDVLGKKYGYDETSLSSPNHGAGSDHFRGDAADFGFNTNKDLAKGVSDLRAGNNTIEAQTAKKFFDDMATLGAADIHYEGGPGGYTYEYKNGNFTKTTEKTNNSPHIHVESENKGNGYYDKLKANPNANLGLKYTCADIERLTGMSVAELERRMYAGAERNFKTKCAGSGYEQSNACANAASKGCKCQQIMASLINPSSRRAMAYGKNTKGFLPQAAGSPATTPENSPTRSSHLDVRGFTGARTFKNAEHVKAYRTMASMRLIDPDATINDEAVRSSPAERMKTNDYLRRQQLVDLQGYIITKLASYQMPVMKGGDQALAKLVSNALPENASDNEKKNLATVANGMIGTGDTLSMAAETDIEVISINSFKYQSELLAQTDRVKFETIYLLSRQIQQLWQQYHIAQMLLMLKTIEMANKYGTHAS